QEVKLEDFKNFEELKNHLSVLVIKLVPVYDLCEYNIKYNLDNGIKNENPKKYTVEDSIVLKAAQRTGYNFLGWYEDSEYKTKIDTISSRTGDINIYPKFEVCEYTINYNIDEKYVSFPIWVTVLWSYLSYSPYVLSPVSLPQILY
ncbi:MAG: InlB B-repeat-containing protein, partial [Clostridia bacterium]|nr:InlB B-repeat-containing protein [Clostridia bacterium]